MFDYISSNNARFILSVVNCWPSESGSSCDVNIEYELQEEDLELNDIVITIPVP